MSLPGESKTIEVEELPTTVPQEAPAEPAPVPEEQPAEPDKVPA